MSGGGRRGGGETEEGGRCRAGNRFLMGTCGIGLRWQGTGENIWWAAARMEKQKRSPFVLKNIHRILEPTSDYGAQEQGNTKFAIS